MSFNLNENHIRTATLAAICLFVLLMFIWMVQQIRATGAYRKAMRSIAESARKGENLTLQVANFSPTTHGKPDLDTDK